jgi:hypothetical protein
MFAMGCGDDVKSKTGGGPPEPTSVSKNISWDLSTGSDLSRVSWPARGTVFEAHNGVQVDLKLPAGKAFRGRVDRVLGRREGGRIRNIDLYFPTESTDAAYKRAQRLAKEWSIDLSNIDEWHKRRLQQRAKGKEDLSDTAFTGSTDGRQIGGGDGPRPAIQMLNSFNRKRPVRVNLSFLWPRPRAGQ